MEVLFVKRSFIIGMVWTAVVVGVISFGVTLFVLESNSKQKPNEKIGEEKEEMVYEIDQSSIRTNLVASLETKKSSDAIIEEKQKKEADDEKETVKKEELEESNEIVEVTAKNTFIRPVKGEIIKPFSTQELVYSKTLGEWNVHLGTDFEAKLGEEVLAVQRGTIKKIASDAQYGEWILLQHENGYESFYANVTVLNALKEGMQVEQGQCLGYVAESAGFEVAEETHLHFALKKDSEWIGI